MLQLRNDCLRLLEEDLILSPGGFQMTVDQLEIQKDSLDQRLEKELAQPWKKTLRCQRQNIVKVFRAEELALKTQQFGQSLTSDEQLQQLRQMQDKLLLDYQQTLGQRLALWHKTIAQKTLPRKLLTSPEETVKAPTSEETVENKAF